MSWVDIIFAIVLVLAMLRGYSKGLLSTAATYIAPVFGFMVASDWSDPVRDWIAQLVTVPEFALDILAPVVVFVAVVVAVRLAAALVARLLGVGQSVPSRILAGLASTAVVAIVLGAGVILVHEIRPPERVRIDNAGDAIADPLEDMLIKLDRQFTESLLAPPLQNVASIVVNEAIARTKTAAPLIRPEVRKEIEEATQKAAGRAVESMVSPPASQPASADAAKSPAANPVQVPAAKTAEPEKTAQNPAPKPVAPPAADRAATPTAQRAAERPAR